MVASPMDTFGSLLRGCISDARASRRQREALEGAGLLLLGILCSLATSYLMAAVGLAV